MDLLEGKIETLYFKYLSAAYSTFSETIFSYSPAIWAYTARGSPRR